MTWAEIKEAAEKAGVKEEDEICMILCENGKGNKSFNKTKLGKALKLSEKASERKGDFSGCAV
jgi:hypothetical protein